MRPRDALRRSWQKANFLTLLLWPFSLLYRTVFLLRAVAYRAGVLKSFRAAVPVIVIGNLTVGGTGKTPMVIYLVEQLRKLGYRPGVISRGYAGRAGAYPLKVDRHTASVDCGDEPALVVRRTGVPMVVGPDRRADIEMLLDNSVVDIIVSDDGLQHLAMQRDIEICLVDETAPGENHCLLPAGPYREPHSRLDSVDIVVRHIAAADWNNQPLSMSLQAAAPVSLTGNACPQDFDASGGVHAVAGIGNPARFFNTCTAQGWNIVEHAFSDHHAFTPDDLRLDGNKPILMTEKDAVKCRDFATDRLWYLPVDVNMSSDFIGLLKKLLGRENHDN